MSRSREELYEHVVSILVKTVGLPREDIAPHKTLRDDLAIDSLSMVEILAVAEDEFEIRIPDEEALQLSDVQSIVDYLERTLPDEVAKS